MKISKVLSVVIMMVMLTVAVSNVALAGSIKDPGDIKGDTTGITTGGIETIGKQIIGIIQIVGSVLAVAILVVLGVKYMMGSAEEKAEYKKTLMPYVIGAVLIFAASNIAGIVFDAVKGLGSTK